ncbi:MAG: hypothetical protein KGM98_11510 [Bacteroidota bacterium]|nr:hypothetical protein [Bacteroidota bacterium]
MKKYYAKLIASLALMGIALVIFQSFNYGDGGSKTVTGEILDMKCYMASGAHGMDHRECASTCIDNGAPMGILTNDGVVYLLVQDGKNEDPYEQAKKYAGEQVTLTGTLSDKGGIKALIVTDIKAKS